MLLSEAINLHLHALKRDPTVTEQMVIFSCEACGRSVAAEDAVLSRDGIDTLYGCPHDHAVFARVSGGEAGRGGGDVAI